MSSARAKYYKMKVVKRPNFQFFAETVAERRSISPSSVEFANARAVAEWCAARLGKDSDPSWRGFVGHVGTEWKWVTAKQLGFLAVIVAHIRCAELNRMAKAA